MVMNESFVEPNLDSLFSMESIGIPNTEASDLDDEKISEFRKNISIKDGKYHVKLPWYEEKLSEVPSNFGIAKAVLNKVVSDLKSNNFFDAYDEVLMEQLNENIIEELDFESINIYNHIWIPHRAVVKVADQCTTKVRPVLNCSLKIKNKPSLNEASYPGVNLLSNLLNLILSARKNRFLVVADIRKAFLQIRLSESADKKRFSILSQNPDGKLREFCYCTLVFGLTASQRCSGTRSIRNAFRNSFHLLER